AEPADSVRECGGISGRDEQCALAVHEQLTRGGAVRRHDGHPARERLKHLVRNHALRLRGRSEDAEGTTRLPELVRQLCVLDPWDMFDVRRAGVEKRCELAAADEP